MELMQNRGIYLIFTNMYLKNIKIKNFRNIENLDLELNRNINVFIGNNAQGKTSILESIYVLAFTKSIRVVDDYDLINKNCDFALIKGLVKSERVSKNMEILLQKTGKSLKINKQPVTRLTDYVSALNVIMFSPDDLDIIKKSPLIRRNLINIELCQLFPNYMRVLNEYNKILKIRNEYIRKSYNDIDRDYLDVLTDKLIDRAIVIMEYRDKFIENVNSYIDNIFYKIMGVHGLKVIYNKSLSTSDKNDIKKFYYDNFFNEVNKKMTLFGPHRDDLTFYLNGDDLKFYGSQGQQRVAILAFKLAEIGLFKECKGYYPIVLLDDIFSELDISKRNKLLKFIKSNIQFIITTTDIKNISEKIIEKADVFKMKNGKIVR